MEEILTGADFSAAADAGAAQAPSAADTSPAQDGSSAGEMLYEKYQAGASVETLNEMIAQEETPSQKDGDTSPEDAGAEADGDAEAKTQKDSRRESAQKKGERTFTQRDVDYLIGKKTSEVTRKHSALLGDLSALLGVDRSEVTNLIRQSRAQGAAADGFAEAYGVQAGAADGGYTQMDDSEFIGEVERQVEAVGHKIPGFDMDKAVDSVEFVDLLQVLTANPHTCARALELAYRTVFADEVSGAAAQAERDRVIHSVRAGKARISEGAAKSGAGAASKVDVARLTDAQIARLAERVAAGEKISF